MIVADRITNLLVHLVTIFLDGSMMEQGCLYIITKLLNSIKRWSHQGMYCTGMCQELASFNER